MPKKSPPRKRAALHSRTTFPRKLTITVEDNDDLASFFARLLMEGYTAWFRSDGRIARLAKAANLARPAAERGHPPFIFAPLYQRQPWKEWKKVLTPALKEFWEEFQGIGKRKLRCDSLRDRCFKSIHWTLASLAAREEASLALREIALPNNWFDQPICKGRVLKWTKLANLMCEWDDAPDFETCKKYLELHPDFVACVEIMEAVDVNHKGLKANNLDLVEPHHQEERS
jgi:hypothetical protein